MKDWVNTKRNRLYLDEDGMKTILERLNDTTRA